MNVEAFGLTIAVPDSQRRERNTLRRLLDPLLADSDHAGVPTHLPDEPGSPATVVQAINRVLAGIEGAERLVLHAGVVEVGDGGVLVAGRSFAGKSTLVAALCQLGPARYGGDELCALDVATGELETYPKPLGLKPSAGPRIERWFAPGTGISSDGLWLVPPDAFRNGLAPRRLRPAAIIFPDRCGCTTVEVVALPPADAAFRVCGLAMNLAASGAAGFRAACALVREVPAYRVTYGEVEGAVEALAGVL